MRPLILLELDAFSASNARAFPTSSSTKPHAEIFAAPRVQSLMKPFLLFCSGLLAWNIAVAATTAPATTGFAPLDYFEEECASCHGAYGSFYGADFGKNLDDKALHEVVESMTAGPAQAPLETRDLEVLTAYHRALRDKKPFLVLVETKEENGQRIWRGEVSPDATLTANGAPVVLNGHRFEVKLPTEQALELEAKRGDASVKLSGDVVSE